MFRLEEWTDIEGAGWEMGLELGLWKPISEDPLSYCVKNKHVFWSDNKLLDSLMFILDELVERGLIIRREDDEEGTQYKSVEAE